MPSQASGEDPQHDGRDQRWDQRDERRAGRDVRALSAVNHDAQLTIRPDARVLTTHGGWFEHGSRHHRVSSTVASARTSYVPARLPRHTLSHARNGIEALRDKAASRLGGNRSRSIRTDRAKAGTGVGRPTRSAGCRCPRARATSRSAARLLAREGAVSAQRNACSTSLLSDTSSQVLVANQPCRIVAFAGTTAPWLHPGKGAGACPVPASTS